MGLDFTFRYHPERKKRFKIEPTVTDGFASLFEGEEELLQAAELLPSFVREYRAADNGVEVETEEDIKALFASIPADPDEWDLSSMEWGPSEPFDPEIAAHWAHRWILLIKGIKKKKVALAFFPYHMDIKTGKSTFGKWDKKYIIKDLRQLIAQAECAAQHNVRMTVESLRS